MIAENTATRARAVASSALTCAGRSSEVAGGVAIGRGPFCREECYLNTAELSDRIVAEVHSGPADLEWTSRVRAEASALRRALLAHRDGAELVASAFALGLGSRTAHDRLAAAIATGGFDDESVQRSTAALLHFVLGHVLHEQQRQQHRELGVHGDAPPAAGQDDAPEAGFAFGVDLLVGGLQFRRAGV